MKNREKYKNELIEVINKNGRICGFMKKHDVFRMIGKDWESFCEMDCIACGTALQIWLDEEYKEPEVDWDHVPVDTLVRVRDLEVEKFKTFYRMYQDNVYGGRPMPKSDKVIMASLCKVALTLTTISERTKERADEWLEVNNFTKGIWR